MVLHLRKYTFMLCFYGRYSRAGVVVSQERGGHEVEEVEEDEEDHVSKLWPLASMPS